VICFDVLGTRKCQNFKFLTKSRFTTNRTCYTLLNFRKNPTGGVSIEMAEPIRDFKTNATCDISGTVTELSNVKWNEENVKQNVIF
jgi:hypothetical protein